jgi:putative FmdB family regulatory protein
MPIYEYKCEKGHTFERRQSFSDEPIDVCPECSAKARRVIHAVPVTFKGSGWYVNDHGRTLRSDSQASESKSTNGASEKSSSEKPSSSPAPKESGKSSSTSTPSQTKSS